MIPDFLLSHFHRISEAPDAIPRLRRFILDLAVRGKLVPQDPREKVSADLLELVEKNSASLIKDLPGWASGKLERFLELRYGKGLAANNRKEQGGVPVFGSNGIVSYTDAPLTTNPSIIIGRKGSAGALNLCDGPSWTTDVAYFVEPPAFFNIRFLLFSLETLNLGMLGKGVKPGLSRADAYLLSMAVPPLAEQHRIVAKVDELMKLCDRLEAVQAERENQRDHLVAASLHGFNNGGTADAIGDHTRFALRHLPRLTTRPEQISEFRQTILSLAIRGRLVAQDPNDESVATQLSLCDQMRLTMAKEDRRADAAPQALLVADNRWDVPTSWEWRGLADLVLFIDYRGKTPYKVEAGVRLITAKNVKKGFVNLLPEEFLSERDYHLWMTRGFPREGDILFTTEAPMGNAAVVRLPERFALAQRVICFRSYGAMNPDFLMLQLLSEPFQAILDKTATGLTAKGIKAAKLKRLPVVVPPLAEQRRIVSKVDELMILCRQLEEALAATQAGRTRLLEAVLHETLGPALRHSKPGSPEIVNLSGAGS